MAAASRELHVVLQDADFLQPANYFVTVQLHLADPSVKMSWFKTEVVQHSAKPNFNQRNFVFELPGSPVEALVGANVAVELFMVVTGDNRKAEPAAAAQLALTECRDMLLANKTVQEKLQLRSDTQKARGHVVIGLFLTSIGGGLAKPLTASGDSAASDPETLPPRTVQLHVHSGLNLSTELGLPDAFVTGKSMREAVARTPAKAATHVARGTRHPLWNDAVTVPLRGDDAESGELFLTIVNNQNKKLLGRCAIPMTALSPGKQFPLDLDLGQQCHLFVNLMLDDTLAHDRLVIQTTKAFCVELFLVQLRQPISPPCQELIAGVRIVPDINSYKATADMSLNSGGQLGEGPQFTYCKIKATEGKADTEKMRAADAMYTHPVSGYGPTVSWNSHLRLTESPSVFNAESSAVVVEIFRRGTVDSAALKSANAREPISLAGNNSIVAPTPFEFCGYGIIPLKNFDKRIDGQAALLDGLPIAGLNNSLRLVIRHWTSTSWASDGWRASPLSAEAARTPIRMDSSGTGTDGFSPRQLLTDSLSDNASLRGSPQPLGGFSPPPASVSPTYPEVGALPENRTPSPRPAREVLLPQTSESPVTVNVSPPRRSSQHAPVVPAVAVVPHTDNLKPTPHRQQQPQQELSVSDVGEIRTPLSSPFDTAIGAALNDRLGALATEMKSKQTLIDRLLKDVDARTAALKKCGEEIVDLRKQNQKLSGECAQLRHQVKAREVADSDIADAAGIDLLPAEELRNRCRALATQWTLESRRRTETQARLTTAQNELIKRNERERYFQTLQQAHAEQTGILQKLQADTKQLAKFKRLAKTQEQVIKKLEGLLAEQVKKAELYNPAMVEPEVLSAAPIIRPDTAVVRERDALKLKVELAETRARAAEAERDRLTLERQRKLSVPTVQAPATATAAAVGDMEEAFLKEKQRLSTRAEQADKRAEAAEEELIAQGKRYAQQLAQLRIQLAEKTAAADARMGGKQLF